MKVDELLVTGIFSHFFGWDFSEIVKKGLTEHESFCGLIGREREEKGREREEKEGIFEGGENRRNSFVSCL